MLRIALLRLIWIVEHLLLVEEQLCILCYIFRLERRLVFLLDEIDVTHADFETLALLCEQHGSFFFVFALHPFLRFFQLYLVQLLRSQFGLLLLKLSCLDSPSFAFLSSLFFLLLLHCCARLRNSAATCLAFCSALGSCWFRRGWTSFGFLWSTFNRFLLFNGDKLY